VKKLLLLNIRHGGGKRCSALIDYFLEADADTIVLTEYRHNDCAQLLHEGLHQAGYIHSLAAVSKPRINGVAVFSKSAFEGTLHPRLGAYYRHRVLTAQFDGLLLCALYFPIHQEKARLFQFLLNKKLVWRKHPCLILGDFNTGLHYVDEPGKTFYCADRFAALESASLIDAWRSRQPDAREFTWYSHRGNGFRLDHAFASAACDQLIERCYYDHTTRTSGLSDHSAMFIEFSEVARDSIASAR